METLYIAYEIKALEEANFGEVFSEVPFLLESSQEVQYFFSLLGTVGKDLHLCVLQLGATVKRTLVLLSFWIPPLCWKKSLNSTVANFCR